MAASDLGAVAFAEFLRKATAVTKGAVYNCMSSSELQTLQKSFTAAGGHWSTFVIWAKATCSKNAEICPSILGRRLFRNNHSLAAGARPPRRMRMGLRMGMDRNGSGGETPSINLIRLTLTHL